MTTTSNAAASPKVKDESVNLCDGMGGECVYAPNTVAWKGGRLFEDASNDAARRTSRIIA